MAKITKAFIQERGNGKLSHEEKLIAEELENRNIPIAFYTAKRIRRRELTLDDRSLIVGDIDCVLGAIKQLKIPEPLPNDYPSSLNYFLHRRIWRMTLAELERQLRDGKCNSIFAKPATRRKRFTGCIFDSESDLYRVYGVSRQEKLFCSEVVNWLSEYRIYVVNSEIRSIDYCDGDKNIFPDINVIKTAIKMLDSAGESLAGYASDWGVLDNGKTALIEMNGGFSLGAYQIDRQNYTDLILARWEEILNSKNN